MKRKIENIYNALCEQRDSLKGISYDDSVLLEAVFCIERALDLLLQWDD